MNVHELIQRIGLFLGKKLLTPEALEIYQHLTPEEEEQLREVLGHTPLQALGGVILGIVVAQLTWFIWR